MTLTKFLFQQLYFICSRFFFKYSFLLQDMNEPLNFLNGSDEGCPNTEYDNLQYLPGRPYPLNTLTLCMSANHNKTKHYNEHNLVGYREAIATHKLVLSISRNLTFIYAQLILGQFTFLKLQATKMS